jgi:acetylornithine/succinyldiaminopimelate/putrescine aminotransferase
MRVFNESYPKGEDYARKVAWSVVKKLYKKEGDKWVPKKKAKASVEEIIAQSSEIKAIRRIGMMFAFDMESSERVAKVVAKCLEKEVLTFWFLSHPYSFRLSPPLIISEDEIREAGKRILEAIAETTENHR